MHNRMTSRPRQSLAKGKAVAKAPARQGNTLPVQGDRPERSPRAPHERDESADSQGASEPTAARIAQAGREDIERGVVDTDKGPVLDETYEKLRDEAPDPVKKFSP